MSQFDEVETTKPAACALCEAMCPDAVDLTLTPAEQRLFDAHIAGCVSCAQELAEAQRGAAWLAMLKGHVPEPPAALLQRILAETTGAAAVQRAAQPAALPVFAAPVAEAAPEARFSWGSLTPTQPVKAPWFESLRRSVSEAFTFRNAGLVFQPRLAMTAAMAFFSIALTMNLAGVRISDVERGISQPSSLRRSVADAGASARRSFRNLRVVSEVEARVSDLRNDDRFRDARFDDQDAPGGLDHSGTPQPAAPAPNAAPDKQPDNSQKSVPQGSSELQMPVSRSTATRKGV